MQKKIGHLRTHATALALLALALLAPEVSAQWTYRAAPDPQIRNIRSFFNTPVAGTNTLVVSTITDGMYKGTDNGTTTTWQKINTGLPTLAVRSHNAVDIDTYYASTDGFGLYKTSNGGANWTALNGFGATAIGCMNVRLVNTFVGLPNMLVVGTACRNGSGFYQTTDGGATWSRLGAATLPDDVQVSNLLTVGTTYYTATQSHGIFKSTDSGATWAAANNGITGTNAFNIVQGVTGSTTQFAAYIHGSGVYTTIDAGANWTASNTGLPAGAAALGGISRDGASATTLYMALDKQGVYRSTDSGANWSPWGITGTGDARFTRTVARASANTYYLGTLWGIMKTINNAASFTFLDMGGGGRVNSIALDAITPTVAYIAVAVPVKVTDIYAADYSSATVDLDAGITGSTADGVVSPDPSNPAILYATTTNRGVFKSTNGGTLWSPINTGLPSLIGRGGRLAIDRNNNQVLYLGLGDGAGMYKSVDGGANWAPSSTGLVGVDALTIGFVLIDQNNSSIVYATTAAGLYKSIDAGANWTLKYSAVDSGGSPLGVGQVRVRTGNSLEVYIANNHANSDGTLAPSSGLLRSVNGGDAWTNIFPAQRVSQVRVLNNGDIYAGVSATVGNPAVYVSTDGGATFNPNVAGLNGSDIRDFGVSADNTSMVALSLENGFYTYSVPGAPSITAITPGDSQASVSFTAPGTTGGSPITGYTVTCNPGAITATGAASPIVVTGLTNGQLYSCSVKASNAAGTGPTSATMDVTPVFSGVLTLLAVQSRKTHGLSGAFDTTINATVPIAGAVTVEPRAIGAGHTIVFQFNDAITATGTVATTVGTATAVTSGNNVVVTLMNVPDNSRTTVSLTGVNGAVNAHSASMGFLVGDVNNSRSVTATDILQVKGRSGQVTDAINFKFDLNASGSITATDILAVKGRSGLVLP